MDSFCNFLGPLLIFFKQRINRVQPTTRRLITFDENNAGKQSDRYFYNIAATATRTSRNFVSASAAMFIQLNRDESIALFSCSLVERNNRVIIEFSIVQIKFGSDSLCQSSAFAQRD